MKKYFLLLLFLFVPVISWADEPQVALEKANISPYDTASIKRGAKFFATVCMACHALVYMRYDEIAKEAGITYDKMNFTVKYFGILPPDLSLITRWRSPDWVYTYLHSFYIDATRPTGFNNLVYPNSVMPNFLAPFQGQQVLATDKTRYMFVGMPQWYDLLVLQQQGSMTPQQFDATITDVVNFLAYAAEPYRVDQIRLGYWVIGFFIVFFFFAWRLKREYWKDIKKRFHTED